MKNHENKKVIKFNNVYKIKFLGYNENNVSGNLQKSIDYLEGVYTVDLNFKNEETFTFLGSKVTPVKIKNSYFSSCAMIFDLSDSKFSQNAENLHKYFSGESKLISLDGVIFDDKSKLVPVQLELIRDEKDHTQLCMYRK